MKRPALVLAFACVGLLLANAPARAQADLKAIVVKHLTTSRDFTLKVAEQMPEADYGFKLTPPQMSFGEQMAHLASDQAGWITGTTLHADGGVLAGRSAVPAPVAEPAAA